MLYSVLHLPRRRNKRLLLLPAFPFLITDFAKFSSHSDSVESILLFKYRSFGLPQKPLFFGIRYRLTATIDKSFVHFSPRASGNTTTTPQQLTNVEQKGFCLNIKVIPPKSHPLFQRDISMKLQKPVSFRKSSKFTHFINYHRSFLSFLYEVKMQSLHT